MKTIITFLFNLIFIFPSKCIYHLLKFAFTFFCALVEFLIWIGQIIMYITIFVFSLLKELIIFIYHKTNKKTKYTKGSTPTVFVNEYIIEEEPTEKVGIFESIFSNKKEEKELSWQEKEFEKEAKLWGLSEEDKRIAKEERMSPADFIEAEERDDDELITDEWEDKL